MKREYKSPAILVVAINMERHLLTPSKVQGNTNLHLGGKSGTVQARSRESSFFADDEDVFDE